VAATHDLGAVVTQSTAGRGDLLAVGDVRDVFDESLADFQRAVDATDMFGLHRSDTQEWPRYEMTLRAARERGPGVLVDLGGYFGVIAHAATRFGYEAHLVDSYGPIGSDHPGLEDWWSASGITAHDIDLQRGDLRLPFDDDSVDLVTLLAVIEHFPNSPRLVLEEARRILKPGGLFIVDTPNGGQFGARVGFALHGGGLWSDIGELYHSPFPFPGHKRCYNRKELVQVLDWAGFDSVDVRMFDLDGDPSPGGFVHRLLYGRVYPLVARRWPEMRSYLWAAATKA
jgi:SAM-dependent methyltransferase